MFVENQAWLSIVSDHLTPDQITTAVGMEPDVAMLQGSRDAEAAIPRFNAWRMRSNEPKWDSAEEHLDALMQRIDPETAERIASLVDREHTEVFVEISRHFRSGQLEPSNTGLLFSERAVRFLASVHAQFGFAETFDDTLEPNTYGPWMPDIT